MTADSFVESLRSDHQTPLSRLGSSKSLYADTAGEMDPDTVVAAALADERAAAETFDAWAEDMDGPLGEAFGDAADLARDHADTLDRKTDASVPDPSVVYETMADRSSAVRRLGTVVGRSLVDEQKTTQRTGFFTGQADPQTSRTFRGFGQDVEAQCEQAVDILAGQCEDADDWAAAEDAASAVVEAAYDEYVETLESMGVNPKDVC